VKKTLLFVHHTVSPATHALQVAAMEGATDPSITEVEIVVRPALSASAVEVLAADGYLLGSPVNLGYLSGALKHFFDQIYYPCLDATRRRPFGVYLHANNDATGALRALDAIVTGLQWQRAQAPLVVTGDPSPSDLEAARQLGRALAAGLTL
jgi:NAD(P)H-dependent FMN reductase